MVEKVPSFKHGGAFWFTDLTTPDSMYIFPVLTALTFWITVEVSILVYFIYCLYVKIYQSVSFPCGSQDMSLRHLDGYLSLLPSYLVQNCLMHKTPILHPPQQPAFGGQKCQINSICCHEWDKRIICCFICHLQPYSENSKDMPPAKPNCIIMFSISKTDTYIFVWTKLVVSGILGAPFSIPHNNLLNMDTPL